MWFIWHSWGLVTLAFVLSVPVAVAVAWLWARLRVRRGVPAWAALSEAVIFAGTAPWLVPLLAHNPNPLAYRQVLLTPFTDVSSQFAGGPRYIAIEVGGNLAVFAVFGFFLPIRYQIGLLPVIAAAAAMSASIETAQYVFDLHRITSTDDVIINTTGALLGALASRRWWRRRRSPAPGAGRLPASRAGEPAVPPSEQPESTKGARG